jgi:hypothetical protein
MAGNRRFLRWRGDRKGRPFAFWEPFRRDLVLRLLDPKLPINIRGVVGLRKKRGFRRTIKAWPGR